MNSISLLSIHSEKIEKSILIIRAFKVMVDSSLAELYGVSTKALNQAVKRNKHRFPSDFYFQLTQQEKEEVVTNCDHLRKLRFSATLPNVFTEHGALMLASVLNSKRAIAASIFVVRAFLRLREMLSAHKELTQKLMELEGKIQKHDHHIKALFDAIYQMMNPPISKKRRIGF